MNPEEELKARYEKGDGCFWRRDDQGFTQLAPADIDLIVSLVMSRIAARYDRVEEVT